MTVDIGIVILLLIAALVFFASERIRTDLTAVMVMAVLLLTGILTPEEGLSGFSNPATVTVAAMFVISAALRTTGAVGRLALLTTRMFGRSFWSGMLLSMLLIGVMSAFVNNTPVVAVFIPVLLRVSQQTGLNPSRLLLPMSFASMFGGVTTLIGTSTNILVSTIAEEHGYPAFGMFEFSMLGALFFIAGIIYMFTAGIRLIPVRGQEGDLTERYDMADYLTDVVLQPDAPSIGQKVSESRLVQDMEVDVLEVIRDGRRIEEELPEIVLRAGDIMRLRCDVRQIQRLLNAVGCRVRGEKPLQDKDFDADRLALVEVIIAPSAPLAGKSIREAAFWENNHATALALRHRGELQHTRFQDTRLFAGDAILLEVPRSEMHRVRNDLNFVVASEVELPPRRTNKLLPALAITAGVILAATFNLLPIVSAAVVGSILLVVTRSITLEEVYEAVEWKVIFLLGGIISLGIAMEKTGLAGILSTALIDIVGDVGPLAVLAALYLLTALLTGVMSNNATAILIAPIAIAAAEALGISARPMLIAVTFAASASFMTPVGYQTNTMIYGVGQYRFADFLKVGTPLTLLFWLLAVLFIPVFFPF